MQLDEIHCKDEFICKEKFHLYCFFTSLSKNVEKQPAIADEKEHKRKITAHCIQNAFGRRRFT